MTEKDEKNFKIEDRRTSSGKKGDATSEPAAENRQEPSPEEPAGEPREKDSGRGAESSTPQVDFSTFIFSLFSSALIQLGDMADPVTGQLEKNLHAAKQTIDILDILDRKTEGNLTDEEAKLLKNASAELKWKYIDAAKGKE